MRLVLKLISLTLFFSAIKLYLTIISQIDWIFEYFLDIKFQFELLSFIPMILFLLPILFIMYLALLIFESTQIHKMKGSLYQRFYNSFSEFGKIELTYGTLAIVFHFMSFLINGNPIFYNNIAIAKEWEEGQQKGIIVYSKKDESIADSFMDNMEYNEDDLYWEPIKKKFLFHQAAVFEGFESHNKSYKGLIGLFSCMMFNLFEKIIWYMTFLLIPFSVYWMIVNNVVKKKT